MAKGHKAEGFGEADPKIISPLAFQRTDEGIDSLHASTPDTAFTNVPNDPAGFIPKCKGDK